METNHIYASSGGIRTYLHLLDSIDIMYMPMIFILLADMLENG